MFLFLVFAHPALFVLFCWESHVCACAYAQTHTNAWKKATHLSRTRTNEQKRWWKWKQIYGEEKKTFHCYLNLHHSNVHTHTSMHARAFDANYIPSVRCWYVHGSESLSVFAEHWQRIGFERRSAVSTVCMATLNNRANKLHCSKTKSRYTYVII